MKGKLRRLGIIFVFLSSLTALIVFYVRRLPIVENDPKHTSQILMEHIKNMLNDFQEDCGRFPTTEEGLNVLFRKPSTVNCSRYREMGYIQDMREEKFPLDRYGKPFLYKSDSKYYEIRSSVCNECFYSNYP